MGGLFQKKAPGARRKALEGSPVTEPRRETDRCMRLDLLKCVCNFRVILGERAVLRGLRVTSGYSIDIMILPNYWAR
jgi:hypothetical protein